MLVLVFEVLNLFILDKMLLLIIVFLITKFLSLILDNYSELIEFFLVFEFELILLLLEFDFVSLLLHFERSLLLHLELGVEVSDLFFVNLVLLLELEFEVILLHLGFDFVSLLLHFELGVEVSDLFNIGLEI